MKNDRIINPHSATDKPFTTKIKRIKKNTPSIKTFWLDYAPNGHPVNMLPGQFFMVWIPGSDEIPMSISYIGPNEEVGITVQNVGETTELMHQLKIGDYIGIRGPYGTPFDYRGDFSVFIGGGVGTAALRELIVGAFKHFVEKPIVIIGAKTENELLFKSEFEDIDAKFQYAPCTDDGSCGHSGFVTEYFDKHIKDIIEMAGDNSKITVYTCGPEIMMYKIFQTCEKHNINMQASLERMMRCGFGICGLCVLDPTGLKVCQDGPVFASNILRKTYDFGKKKRTFSGEKVDL